VENYTDTTKAVIYGLAVVAVMGVYWPLFIDTFGVNVIVYAVALWFAAVSDLAPLEGTMSNGRQ